MSNVHLVFHDDIDGIFSAAIFLHNQLHGRSYRLYPITSSNRGDKFAEIVKGMGLGDDDVLVVLDYEYHARANLWVDHHWDRRMGNEPVYNDKIRYDPTSKSAARLVHEMSNNDDYDDAFLSVVDMIDQADYKDIDQIFNDTHPIMILRAYLEKTFPAEMMYCRLAEVISMTQFNMEEAISCLKLDASCVHSLRKDVKRAKKYMTIFGNVSVIRQKWPNQFPRYAEFLIRPETRYAVRVSDSGHEWEKGRKVPIRLYFQIGYNRWLEKDNDIHIGAMLNSINYLIKGGGHYNVGGGLLKPEDVEKFLDDLDVHLNKAEEMGNEDMEKYGVDAEVDPVEAKAAEMVKTGEAKNIDEARKNVLSGSDNSDEEDQESAAETTQ